MVWFHRKKTPPETQIIHYNRNQVYPGQDSPIINGLGTHHAHQVVHNSQINGSLSLQINHINFQISQATVNAFCTDFVRNYLAGSKSLSGSVLEGLEDLEKISIHFRENSTGEVCKHNLASGAPKIAISASIVAGLGDFSQIKDIIEEFFSYTYSKSVTSYEASSTHYYANDQHTVTGCYLYREIHSRKNTLKTAVVQGKRTEIHYETKCYLFTFKVAQAAKFLEKHLNM